MAANIASRALARRGVLCGSRLGTPPWVLDGRARASRRRCGRAPWAGRGYATIREPGDGKPKASGENDTGGPNGEDGNGGRLLINKLFDAIRADNPRRLYQIMEGLREEKDWLPLLALPAAEFEELLQSLDPMRVHDRVDLLSELCLAPAMIGYGFADHLVENRGSRRIYTRVFPTVYDMTQARVMAGIPTPPGVFTVLFRLAGAATRPGWGPAIRRLSRAAARGLQNTDPAFNFHGALFTEYIRMMFLTERLYHCYDETWMRVRARDMLWYSMRLPSARVSWLDHLRLHVHQGKGHSFGSDPNDRYDMLHRRVSRWKPMRQAMPLSRLRAATPDEDLICAAIVASTRSGRRMFVQIILRDFYGIETTYLKKGEGLLVRGGNPIPPESPIRPTAKLLVAVCRALGSIAEPASAMKLINHISQLYDIPVPDEVWSEWIRWVYVHGAKPASEEWRIVNRPGPAIAKERLPAVLKALREGEQGFTPRFGDLLIMAKHRISEIQLVKARSMLRLAKAIYDETLPGLEAAAAVEASARAQGVALPPYTSRRTAYGHLLTERGVMHHELQSVCMVWLKEVRVKARYRTTQTALEVLVPDFVAEFWDVLPQRIEYRTKTGDVLIEHDEPRVELTKQHVKSHNIRMGANVRVKAEAAAVDGDAAATTDGAAERPYGGYWDQEAQPGNRYWQDQAPDSEAPRGQVPRGEAPDPVQPDQARRSEAPDDEAPAPGTPTHGRIPADQAEPDANCEWIRETHVIQHVGSRHVRSPLPRPKTTAVDGQEWWVGMRRALVIRENGKIWMDEARRGGELRAD